MWDVGQYERFKGERARPFFDLVARLPDRPFSSIADLGSGTGELTRHLADRHPAALTVGVELDEAMLKASIRWAVPGRVDFVQGDLATWDPGRTFDLVFSNAALQWLPDHDALLARLAGFVAPGGVFAAQMPANFDAPSHVEIRSAAAPWQSRLAGLPAAHVDPLDRYIRRLLALGFTVDAWETTYVHALSGDDAVLDWVKGTALRPILDRLDDPAPFLADLDARLRRAYPSKDGLTLFPFRRLFVVAARKQTV